MRMTWSGCGLERCHLDEMCKNTRSPSDRQFKLHVPKHFWQTNIALIVPTISFMGEKIADSQVFDF
jgi:hypothetical protein